MSQAPGFLRFVTDQHRADHLGCYGNPEVLTPHVDALAAAGYRVDAFHVATPICQPNRASLMTGRLPSVHGLQMNGRELSLGNAASWIHRGIFPSDHWDLVGERKPMFKGGLHCPALTRVPFIWRDPARPRVSPASAALAQTIDIAATVLERVGLPATNGMQGQSLLPLMDGVASAVRGHRLIEEESQRSDFGMDRRVRMRTLRDHHHHHRLTINDGQSCGERYDLAQDPLDLRNLWNHTASQPLRQSLSEQLARAMLAAADTSPCPDAAA